MGYIEFEEKTQGLLDVKVPTIRDLCASGSGQFFFPWSLFWIHLLFGTNLKTAGSFLIPFCEEKASRADLPNTADGIL